MDKLEINEIEAKLAAHRLWLETSGTEGERFKVRDVNLRYAELSGANLRSARIKNCDLQSITMTGADLTDASFAGCDLRSASLIRVTARGTDMSGCNFTGAAMRDADLFGAELYGTNFCAVALSSTSLIIGGTRADGYRFDLHYDKEYGQIRLITGCRNFTIAQAREHWEETRPGTLLGDESQFLITELENRAILRGWIK